MKNRASGILIENGKILLIKRIKDNNEYYVIPGGGIEANENIIDATKRELKEEANIDVKLISDNPLYTLNETDRCQYFMLVEKVSGEIGIGSGPEYTNNNNGIYLPIMIDLKDIINENINLKPNEFKNELINIINNINKDIPLINSIDIYYYNLFNKICNKYNLGNYKDYKEITGGLTNKMYKLITDSGEFAIKVINQDNLLNNPNLYNKIEKSEEIANIAFNNNINSVCAIKYNDKYIQEIDGNNILIYKWCNGIILKTCELTLEHVRLLAKELAKLHSIKVSDKVDIIKYNKIDYRKYYKLLKDNNEEWSLLFREKIDDLVKLYDKVYDSYLKLSNQISYVHKDFNRRNVLWNNNIPYIIDWETATIDNPSIDFFNSAWFLTNDVQKDKYDVFASEYFSIMKLEDSINISTYASIIEECNWLEFSLKRALSMHSNDIEEIKLGKNSINGSLTEILNYYDKIPLMIEIINKINK